MWRLIPLLMRRWWIDEVHNLNHHGDYPFCNCTIDTPAALFDDKTLSLWQLESDLASGVPGRLISALKNTEFNNANVLCPFRCSEYCREADFFDFDVMIQRLLLKTIIPMVNDNDKYRNIHFCSNLCWREEGDFDCILMNKAWEIKPSILSTCEGPRILTCRYHGNGSNKMYLYPPRYPNHNLSAAQTYQLSHITVNARIAKVTQWSPIHINTTFQLSRQFGGYAGMDTLNVVLMSEIEA